MEHDEKEIKDGLPLHKRKVLKDKHLALLAEMLTSIGHLDDEVVNDIIAGFRLTGDFEAADIRRLLLSENRVEFEQRVALELEIYNTDSDGGRWSRSTGRGDLWFPDHCWSRRSRSSATTSAADGSRHCGRCRRWGE